MADTVLAGLLAENTVAAETFGQSAGYAVFDMRRVSVFPLSAGYGRGVAVAGSDGSRTYMQMSTGGVGAAFGIGGFESQFVIMFETPVDFDRFVESGYYASVDAGVMEGDDRTTAGVKFTQGRSFFVLSKTGWRVNANASGTKYWKDADLN
jgi:lipid-binding SYLF domain-containing protein